MERRRKEGSDYGALPKTRKDEDVKDWVKD